MGTKTGTVPVSGAQSVMFFSIMKIPALSEMTKFCAEKIISSKLLIYIYISLLHYGERVSKTNYRSYDENFSLGSM